MLVGKPSRSIQDLEDEIKALEAEQGGDVGDKDEEDKSSPPVDSKAPVDEKKQELSSEEETFKKRYGDLRSLSQKQAARIKELEAKKSDSAPVGEEDAKKWAEENPKAAAVIKALALQELKSSYSPQLDDVTSLREEIAKEKAFTKIKKVHEDFDEISTSDEFHNWIKVQPNKIQDLVYDGEADDVIWAISTYKKENAKDTSKDTARESARGVSSKSTTSPTDSSKRVAFKESEVAEMSMAEYEKFEEAILQSQRDGNFVYDLSGGAR